MSRHLADHRKASDGGRLKHFLRIARDGSDGLWRNVWQRPLTREAGNRRVLEFLRIDRGRDA